MSDQNSFRNSALAIRCFTGARMPPLLADAMSLFLRRTRRHDYSVMYRDDADGRELYIGRVFRDHGLVGGTMRWFWTMEFLHRAGRTEPHQGRAENFEDAKAAWRRCWESANLPIHWPPALRRPKAGQGNEIHETEPSKQSDW